MARPPTSSGYRCHHCGSTETRKEGTHRGKQRYLCKACGRSSVENAVYKRAEYWGKRSGARCYHCGSLETVKAGLVSHHLVSRGGSHSSSGRRRAKQRFKCRDCGKFFRENPILPSGSTSRNKKKYNLPTASQLILELQSLAQSVLKKTPTLNDINELSKQGRCHSSATYYAVFGSYVEAVRRARLKQHYLQQFDETDRARLLQELRALSKRLKRPLVGKDVREAAAPTIPSDRKGALKDLPPRPSATPPIQGGELDRHASLVKRGAKRLPSGNYKDRLVSPINHFWAVFGTIPKAIAAAGVGPKLTYSNEELIAHLRKVATGLDRPVQVSDLEKLYREGKGPAPETIEHRFGGLAKARKAAGVLNTYNKAGKRTNYWQKYTPEELIGQLKALGKKLGKKPTLKDVNRASKEGMCASHTTLKGMFGSIPQAFRAAGFHEIEKNARKHTDREIIFAIKKLKKELGRFPGYHDFLAGSKAGKCPSPGTIVRRIGKLTEIRDRF